MKSNEELDRELKEARKEQKRLREGLFGEPAYYMVIGQIILVAFFIIMLIITFSN